MRTQDAQTIAGLYNQFGQQYHDARTKGAGSLYNEFLDMPATMSLLPKNLKGLCALDAGCGSGIYCRLLAARGAVVTGIDVSETMIQIARKQTPVSSKITYVNGSLSTLPFEDSSFDLILCTYVLENIENISQVFAEFYRVITKNGECIFSISHPLRALSDKQTINGQETWVISNYFKEGMRQTELCGVMTVPKYTRTLETYVGAFTSAGFVLSSLLEARPVPEGKKIDPEKYATSMRLPQLLTVKLVKLH